MKTVAFASLIAGVAAFAPASNTQRKLVSLDANAAELEGMIGVDVETGGKIFDPLELAQWAPIDHLRKAELANGRSAMLASVGWFFPKVFGTFDSNDVTTTDPMEAILQADPQWWAQFIIFCAVIEGLKYRGELDGKSFTGEGPPVIDWSGSWGRLSDDEKQTMRLKELKNGRLAMIGVASYIADYFIPGSVPGIPQF